MKILFVCLGNICRSPLAEGVFRHWADRSGRSGDFEPDSAGTAAYHEGELPDDRSRKIAISHGIRLTHRARQVKGEDFDRFDLILAMDRDNLSHLQFMAPHPGLREKIRLFRDFDPLPGDGEVPDPYYGGLDGFRLVFEMSLRVSQRLLETF